MAEKTEKAKSPVQVKAHARQLHIAPRKIRLVTNAVKDMYVSDALVQLQHLNKKGAPMVAKLLKSAVADASHNFSLNPEFLYIKSITADAGSVMKRYFPRARGSAFVIRRKLSHVNVILEEKKRKGGKASRMALLKKFTEKKDEVKDVEVKMQEEGKVKSETKTAKRSAPKTSEQKKMNTAQQKRRLFTRKTGE